MTPSELIARVSSVGLTTISVTDHDTVAALAEVRQLAAAADIALVPGIEVTSVHQQSDVHILGYFIDESDRGFARFLQVQRTSRVERVREIGARLAQLGFTIDVDRLIEDVLHTPGVSIGRPTVARTLIAAGYVTSVQEAFDRLLGAGQPAFVPRIGRSPRDIIEVIHAAGGVASLAHPGITNKPELMAPLADHGLDAIEAYHTDHTPEMRHDALAVARQLNLLVSGGSDYHGDDERRPIGVVTLPQSDFDALSARARR